MGPESKKTASRHTTETETGTHTFEVIGYTFKKGIGISNSIQSGTFTIGGSDWCIRIYPDGFANTREYVAIYLVHLSMNANVRASYRLSLVNQTTGLSDILCSETIATEFNSFNTLSLCALIERSKLESKSAGYIVNNGLIIECNVTVIKESQVLDITRGLDIEVPPSDLPEHFAKLLVEEESADVTFSVGREKIPAHKIVLATRSPVFKAELYGQTKERRPHDVTVDDMQPQVFKALLRFIYTDSLPDWDEPDVGEYCGITRHLLVAADRYAMDRLKFLCARLLVKYLDAETVATTLVLADQHNCDRLKEVCIEFMTYSGEMDAVVATQGYANLKRTSPSILVDVLEKISRHCKK
ncbi:hypothetical protein PR202_gb25576 [Eleusine coracana subsp. coracana]|uniref:Uncharacterized protein n=1 Tax=Eleusine coracana subsp. coracana TaxID=191504 RepID=A0AAV5FPB9_ELECO|nr:hypothetical protein QOZ80_8BG0650500 [Eleusine coracana subsp. coracana]GJN36693.1 hypothetical protein PR202_gb25576 [Eleusine coracana subsp. coracana]